MDVETFLSARWEGAGCIRGPTGRVVRRFTTVLVGAWSEPHDAFHLDETVAYVDGRSAARHWGVSYDGLGRWTGADDVGGRISLREHEDGRIVLRFDRSKAVRAFSNRTLRLVLRPRGGDVLEGRGVTRVLGLPLARTELTYVRRDAPAAR